MKSLALFPLLCASCAADVSPGLPTFQDPPYRAETGAREVVQGQTQWCWAAAASMVGNTITGLDLPQCELVSETTGLDCCAAPDLCNRPGGTGETPLARVYGLRTAALGEDRTTADFLRVELALGHPVILAYRFPEGNSHVVTLTGYEGMRFRRWNSAGEGTRDRPTFEELSRLGSARWTWTRTAQP